MPQDFNSTLNLPQSEFPMRGNLPAREPERFAQWDKDGLYNLICEKNKDKPSYILHDGPPYANADIHMGTALNKVLKDFVIRYKNMAGFRAPMVPGWDTHGLPIELKALKQDGVAPTAIDAVSLRKLCRAYAMSFVESQKKQFKSLGVLGDFDHPYLTLRAEFEAKQIEIFGDMAKKGYIYKGLKPVYWCRDCHTALAEAEIEYAEDSCHSIYVKFQVTDDKGLFAEMVPDIKNVWFVIWTTTTWTLPGNVAICLGPDYTYALIKTDGAYLVMAEELAENALKAAKITEYEIVGHFKGSELEYIKTRHPFLDRESLIITGEHVTLESGTGCVHTAPGHGVEDFEAVKRYKELPIVVPVDDKGIMTEEAGAFIAGKTTEEANRIIGKALEESGHLLAVEKIIHQYPHCWRCKEPILFRATEQWFCSVEAFKEQTIRELSKVEWIPAWGEKRIENMVRDRSDWCISRQRTWGVPIPILYCKDCGKAIVNDTTIAAIAELFREKGSDAWYEEDPGAFLPESVACECGCRNFSKETDIMDVWFDSGVTHAAVLMEREELRWPADLYLEGADQYRGWFQSSLLTSVAWKGEAPYRAVCTHGWVVDGEGRKQSKSLGNGVNPQDITKKYGADILRLWVASSDYHSDIRLSHDILKQMTETYRKVRNTAKYMLGNLYDFNPDQDMVPFENLEGLDRLALCYLDRLIKRVTAHYDAMEFHGVYHAIHKFCVVDMSSFYLDILKDRLYCEKADSLKRRAAQTAMFLILDALTRMLAPILAFTSEEIWEFMPHRDSDDKRSVLLNEMYVSIPIEIDDAFLEKWETVVKVRNDVQKALELKRAENLIGKSLEAKVTLHATGTLYELLLEMKETLPDLLICSQVMLAEGTGAFAGETEGLSITVERADGEKCDRCWIYSESVSEERLCSRCAGVLGK